MENSIKDSISSKLEETEIKERELLKVGSFSFRNLTKRCKDEALQLLGREFGRQEPLTAAYTIKNPGNPSTAQNWSLFYSFFMEDAATNNLSVAVFDTSANDKLIGVFISRDVTYVPEEFPKEFCDGKESAQTFIILLEDELKKQLSKNVLELMSQKGKTADFWAVAIDHAYTGTKIIFKNMVLLVEQLARQAGFTYGTIYAINQKTNIVAKNANYEHISTLNVKEVVMRGQVPYSEVQEFHKNSSLWLKKL